MVKIRKVWDIPVPSLIINGRLQGGVFLETEGYILKMKGISKGFTGVQALDNVQLNVRPGTVHALMGENGAGKSTLMKCLFGIYKKDTGTINFDNKEVDFKSSHAALVNGISMVHQELEQVHERNIMDNLWMGRYPQKGMVVDEKKMYIETKNILESLGIKVDPKKKLKDLTVAQRQMIDIAKAVSYNCKLIVMDEPTSSLPDAEVKHLFWMIAQLKEKNVAIVYISHKMNEIFEIADDITILRDGKWVDTSSVNEIDQEEVVKKMVGRELANLFPPKSSTPGEVVMRVNNLTEKSGETIKDINFELREGEILGIAGLMGAGRTELLETIFGIRQRSAGEIIYKGEMILNKNSTDAVKNKFALLTEERRFNGIFPDQSVAFNSVIVDINNCKGKYGYLKKKKIKEAARWVIESFKVKTPSQNVPIRSLSGGNQQKVIIGRWMLNNPEVILMDDPTRGIDVGAKYEIYEMMIQLVKKGKSIIFSSSEMPELLGVSDRILILSNGKVAGMFETKEIMQKDIFTAETKFL